MHPVAFPQKAWPRLGGDGVPPWGPSMESMFQKTSIFSWFLVIVFSLLLSSKPWKYRFYLGKIDIFKGFTKNALLQFSTNFLLKNLSKTFPKRGLNPSKIDVKNVSFFNIDFFGFWPRFWTLFYLEGLGPPRWSQVGSFGLKKLRCSSFLSVLS